MFVKSQNTDNKINLKKKLLLPRLGEIIFHYGPHPFQIPGSDPYSYKRSRQSGSTAGDTDIIITPPVIHARLEMPISHIYSTKKETSLGFSQDISI